MYQIGELIICGDNGVCKVEAIGKLDMPWIDKNKLYYTLYPVYREGRIFVPIDTSVFMRPVITYSEAQHLIDMIPAIDEIDCISYHYKALKEQYGKLLQTHKCTDLIRLIKTIYIKNNLSLEKGKQPSQAENKIMKQAEDLLHGEFALALGIPKDHVKSYIEHRMRDIERISVNL